MNRKLVMLIVVCLMIIFFIYIISADIFNSFHLKNFEIINVTQGGNSTHLNISTSAPYDSLAAYYSFDADTINTLSTTYYDFTPNNIDGTALDKKVAIVNGTGCIYGNCLQSNVTSGINLSSPSRLYFGNPSNAGIPYNFTITGLVYYLPSGGNEGILKRGSLTSLNTRDQQYMIWRPSNDVIRLSLGNGTGATTASNDCSTSILTSNTWYHFACGANDTHSFCYLNGASACSTAITITGSPVQNDTMLAEVRTTVGVTGLNGSLDEIMAFNTSLTPTQILNIYNNQSARFVSTGQMNFNYTNLSSSSSNFSVFNKLNISATVQNNMGTNISLQVGFYNSSGLFYTAPQNITVSGQNYTYNITNARNYTLNWTFLPNSTAAFYTPILQTTINLDASEMRTITQCNGADVYSSFGLIPLDDLGAGYYSGVQGGLYPEGNNTINFSHLAAGINISKNITPLDSNGNVDLVNGKIGFASLGMSVTENEFATFIDDIMPVFTGENSKVIFSNGADSGETAVDWANPNDDSWTLFQNDLTTAGLNESQIQVVWIKLTETLTDVQTFPTTTFPGYAKTVQSNITRTISNLKTKYPNVKIAYLSTITYTGYDNISLVTEPRGYDTIFSVKWVIENQINGTNLTYTGNDPEAPWLAWGPYLWADGIGNDSVIGGTPGRNDGLEYECSDFIGDGVHTGSAGKTKVALRLLDFLKNDPTAKKWFLSPIDNTGLLNTTKEDNSTHLNITTSTPYNNLIAYYSFDADAVNIRNTTHYDFTNHVLDGTGIRGANVTSTGCVYGNCYMGNTSDYIEVGYHKDFDMLSYTLSNKVISNVSVSAWLKYNTGGVSLIAYKTGTAGNVNGVWQYGLQATSSATAKQVRFTMGNRTGGGGAAQTATSSATFAPDTWTHAVGIINDTHISVYVNGAYEGSTAITLTESVKNEGTDTTIGGVGGTATTNGWNGSLDEIMVFNVSLTAAQISDIYNNQSARFVSAGRQNSNITNLTSDGSASGHSKINVSADIQNNLGTNLSLVVGYYTSSGWTYTSPQNITTSGQNYTFEISSDTINYTLNWTFVPDSNRFYTPILQTTILTTPYGLSQTTSSSAVSESGGGGDYIIEKKTGDILEFQIVISPNKSITRKILEDKGTGIKEIEIRAKDWISGKIFVTSYDIKPEFCSIEYDDYAFYKALHINASFNSSLVEESRLRIGISKEWIFDKNVSLIKAVKCEPYYEELVINYLDESEEEGIYDIYSDGFSTLAILGVYDAAGEEPNIPKHAFGKAGFDYEILIWILVIIVIILFVVILRKHKGMFAERIRFRTKWFSFEESVRVRFGKR